jgi:uncharacterized membrane protein
MKTKGAISAALAMLSVCGAAMAQPAIIDIGAGGLPQLNDSGSALAAISGSRDILLWTLSGGPQVIPSGIPTSISAFQRVDIANDGLTVTAQTYDAVNDKARPGVWTQAGGWTLIPEIGNPSSNSYGFPLGISGNGEVVVGRAYAAALRRAFRWDAVNGPTDLTSVGGLNEALGVSTDGQVIIGTTDYNQSPNARGFIVTPGQGVIFFAETAFSRGVQVNGPGTLFLGTGPAIEGATTTPNMYSLDRSNGQIAVVRTFTPPANLTGITMLDLSDDGNVVVGQGAFQFPTPTFGWIWTAERGSERFSDYLAAKGIALPAGFLSITSVTSVSADGKVFAGSASVAPFGTRAWYLDTRPTCNYDFNRDENVDLTDAQLMAQVFVGLVTPEANWLSGDLNGDENADLTDAQLLAQFVVSGSCGL